MPAFGTCAGLILLARHVLDGRPDQPSLDAIDCTVRRNGYGTQLESFEAALEIDGLPGGAFPGVFIRAPVVERVGAGGRGARGARGPSGAVPVRGRVGLHVPPRAVG